MSQSSKARYLPLALRFDGPSIADMARDDHPRALHRAPRRNPDVPTLVQLGGRGMAPGAWLDCLAGRWLAGRSGYHPSEFRSAREAWDYAHRLARLP